MSEPSGGAVKRKPQTVAVHPMQFGELSMAQPHSDGKTPKGSQTLLNSPARSCAGGLKHNLVRRSRHLEDVELRIGPVDLTRSSYRSSSSIKSCFLDKIQAILRPRNATAGDGKDAIAQPARRAFSRAASRSSIS